MGIFKKWLLGIVAVALTIWVGKLIGLEYKWDSAWSIILFVPILAVVNAVLGTILRLLTIPIRLLTLGLFGFVINAITFWVAGAITGVHMGVLAALFGSVALAIFSSLLNKCIRQKKD